jgi:hypothetical protein
MNLRRAAPVVFVALCLGLSALVLRRQIAAHPVSRTIAAPGEPAGREGPVDPGQPASLKGWHVAAAPARRAAQATVASQLAAIRAGNADGAWFYQSRSLRRNFPSAQAFVKMIARGYPEFGHAISEEFGPVWVNPAGDHAAVTVMVRGENGHLARGYYLLVREDGGYKVAAVGGGRTIN